MRDLCGLGTLEMLRPACRRVTADNSACVHAYYVRTDAENADRFSFAESSRADSAVRGVTEPMAVPAMHALAEEIRKEGGGLFFAAMG